MARAAEEEHAVKAFGWADRDSSGHISPFHFTRRETGEEDVRFKILYCGMCHTDLHFCNNDWGFSIYPLVPGHEIVGEVTDIGSNVKKVKVGDRVGVGCMVGACHSCELCNDNLENYCPKMILTYSTLYHDGIVTCGGYLLRAALVCERVTGLCTGKAPGSSLLSLPMMDLEQVRGVLRFLCRVVRGTLTSLLNQYEIET